MEALGALEVVAPKAAQAGIVQQQVGGWNGGEPGFGHFLFDALRESVAADLSAGSQIDRLESSPHGEDTVILNGMVLHTKQDIVGLLESHLGVNCGVPAGAFVSPHFLLNELM